MIAIIIPTLDEAAAADVGRLALVNAGTDARLIVSAGPRRGFTKTVNDGLRQLEPGEDALLLNDDVSGFFFGWLATLERALYRNDRTGIVGPSGKSNTTPSCHGRPGMVGREKVVQVPFWCALIRRACLDDVGLLDEAYIHYGSDNQYCADARRRGWRIVWCKDVYLEHRKHGSKGQRIGDWWKRDRAVLMRRKREQGW